MGVRGGAQRGKSAECELSQLKVSLWLPFSCTGRTTTELEETSLEVSFHPVFKTYSNAALYKAGMNPLANSRFATLADWTEHLHTGHGHLKEDTDVILLRRGFPSSDLIPKQHALTKSMCNRSFLIRSQTPGKYNERRPTGPNNRTARCAFIC